MKRFKGTGGKWELYGATRSVLHGLVDPDYYQIKCNHKMIADKIEGRADAQLIAPNVSGLYAVRILTTKL